MMRVFIADDEEIIRDGIRNCIEKEQERFLFAGEAPDGEMALPMLMEMKPDVLITDIRMPFMDGLELAKVVRRTMPWLRIVFLSGHDEFEYAQKAVSLHADAYLLKPVSSAQLLETLGQVAEQIEQEQQQLRSEGANSRSEHEEDVLREHFLNDLLSGSVPTAEAAVQGERWGLLLTAKQYLVCIVRLPENAVQEQVRALTERLCGEESEVCAFFRGSRRLVLLLRGETEEAVRETAYEFCQNLRHELCQVLGWNALCAIGAPVSRVSALPESYRTAKDTRCRPPHVRRTAYSAARTLPVCSTSSISRRAARWRTSCGMPPPRTCRVLSRATSVTLRRRTCRACCTGIIC